MANKVLDVRGKVCPVPLIVTKRKLESMHYGEVLEVLSDFPQTRDNIQKIVERMGIETVKVEGKKGTFKIVIRKNLVRVKNRAGISDRSCGPPQE
jgi:tRNA 2-thiouridine synthesizing protein A